MAELYATLMGRSCVFAQAGRALLPTGDVPAYEYVTQICDTNASKNLDGALPDPTSVPIQTTPNVSFVIPDWRELGIVPPFRRNMPAVDTIYYAPPSVVLLPIDVRAGDPTQDQLDSMVVSQVAIDMLRSYIPDTTDGALLSLFGMGDKMNPVYGPIGDESDPNNIPCNFGMIQRIYSDPPPVETTTEAPTTEPPTTITTTIVPPFNVDQANFAWSEVSAARRNARKLMVNHAWTLLLNKPGEAIPATPYERYIPPFRVLPLKGEADMLYYAILTRNAPYADQVYRTNLALMLLSNSAARFVLDGMSQRDSSPPPLLLKDVYDQEMPALVNRLLAIPPRHVIPGLILHADSAVLQKMYKEGCSAVDRAGCVVASLLLLQHATYVKMAGSGATVLRSTRYIFPEQVATTSAPTTTTTIAPTTTTSTTSTTTTTTTSTTTTTTTSTTTQPPGGGIS